MKTLSSYLWLLLLVSILFVKEASAIGVTPGRTPIDFEPGLQQTYEISIVNTEHKQFKAALYLEGELKEFVSLSDSEVSFTPQEASKKISYSIHLPQRIPQPGLHEVRLIISEVSDVDKEKVYTVSIKTEVVHQIHIQVPYPGKYLKNSFYVVEKENSADFLVNTINLGKEDIAQVMPKFEIYNPQGALVTTFSAEEQAVKKRERTEFKARCNNFSAGSYRVKAVVHYDTQQEILEQNISLGNFQLKLLDLFVEGFTLGNIAQFNVLVENIGNTPIGDAYSTLRLDNNEGISLTHLKSASLALAPGERQKMFLYWDTKNVQVGIYDGELGLFYGKDSSLKPIRTRVSENKIDIEVAGVTGAVVGTSGVKSSANILLIGVGGIILLILILTIVKKREKIE